jgi:HSP20 family protein
MTYFVTPYPYRMARRWAHLAEESENNDIFLPVDVREEDEAFVLNTLVPGLKAEDVNIRILNDVVTLEGEFKVDESEYVLHELPHGPFSRTLRLSTPLDAGKAEAKIADGVLTLRLPKAETARPKVIKVAAK